VIAYSASRIVRRISKVRLLLAVPVAASRRVLRPGEHALGVEPVTEQGRRLRRLVLDAGLTVTDLTALALGAPNLDIAKAQFGLFDHLDAAVAAGDVSAEAAAAWRVWLEESDAAAACSSHQLPSGL